MIYQCAITNNALDSVVFHSFDSEVAILDTALSNIETYWHPGLTIPLTLIPILGGVTLFSYFLMGMTLLVYWSESMTVAIEKLVPAYKDAFTPKYDTWSGICARKDGKTIAAASIETVANIETASSCKSSCDNLYPGCYAYQFKKTDVTTDNVTTSTYECKLYKNTETLTYNNTDAAGAVCYIRRRLNHC